MDPMRKVKRKARERPAETVGGIGAVISAVGAILGAPSKVVQVVAIIAASLPAIVTWLVATRDAARGRMIPGPETDATE
jgi:hypothetical protein